MQTLLMKQFILIFFLVFCGTNLWSQKREIKGVVKDQENQEMPFVGVKIQGTNVGTKTNLQGEFSISVPESKAVLEFGFIGYESLQLELGEESFVEVILKKIIKDLDEVVVVGYGTSRKKELTGATSKVKGEDLEKLNLARMDQALQGQVSGVNISTNSGSPGGSSSIRIRGLSTFGDNDPLILVDGVVYDSEGLNALNPSDIKSINVLKDATAGIYGVRAANGVILIETKQGKLNAKPSIEYNAYYGMQQTSRKLDLLNAREYAVIKNEMFAFGGQQMPFVNTELGEGTNWQDSIFSVSPVSSHNLTMTGGTATSRYSLGLGYFNQDGIVGADKAHFSRYNARLNFNTDLSDKWKLNSVFLYSNDYRNTLPENGIGSVLYNTINAFPNAPIRTPDGSYSYLDEVSDIINPVAQIENQYNWNWADKFVGKEELIYEFNEHLSFTNRYNYNYAQTKSKVFSPLVWYGPGKYANSAINADLESPVVEIADSAFIERGAAVYESRAGFVDQTFESYLNYDNTFDSTHRVKVTAGVSVFQRRGEHLGGTAFNIPNNSVEYADISANLAEGGFLNNVSSWEFTERLLSSFVRAEYSLQDKYLFSAILRRDGSSKFGENSRYGFFPTFSGAWVLSDEPFYNIKAIDFWKFRMSYGVSGNDQIANFAYRALLNGEGVYVFDDIITQGVAIGRPSNPDLKWETTSQFNVGMDMTIKNNFDIATNYFIKNTRDLLFQPDVTAILGAYGPGGYPPIINAGDVSNKGIELELAYHTKPGKKTGADIGFNISRVLNKVTAVPEGVDYIPGAAFSVGGDVATRFQEGYAIGYFFGYETAGIYQNQEEIDNASVYQEGAQPGDLIFVDQNGDGEISFTDDSDKTMIGSPIPDFTWGLNMNFRAYGFDFSANIFSAIGQEIIRNYERQQPYANQLGYVIDRWVGEGTSNEVPRVTTGATRNNVFSSFFVEDGSFIRLKNIQLGYTVPKKLLQKAKVEGLRIYISANNLLTLTSYMGYDPDLGSANALSAGVDMGQYPQATTIMGGIQVKF